MAMRRTNSPLSSLNMTGPSNGVMYNFNFLNGKNKQALAHKQGPGYLHSKKPSNSTIKAQPRTGLSFATLT